MPSTNPFNRSNPFNRRTDLQRRGSLTLLLVVSVAAAALLLSSRSSAPAAAATARVGASSAHQRAAVYNAEVTRSAGAPIKVPRSFLGISAEYWTIPTWGREVRILHRVVSMLSPYGLLRLRIGGDSADRVQWSPTKELPEWVFELTPSWLQRVRGIVTGTGASVILDINILTSTPKVAAHWAQTALRVLPKGSISAFEIGNEPDIYNQGAWLHMTAGPGAPPLPNRITSAGYAHSFAVYARAISRVAPGIPLLGPALAEPQKNSDWVRKLLQVPHPKLAGITVHRYPYSACARQTAPTWPTIPRVLSQNATAGMGQLALKLEHITDRAKLPLWFTEIDSVTCGGVRGVSNTFATALWAPDALFELLRSGVEAAFVHVRPPLINKAFSLTSRGLTSYPLLYGMVVFSKMLGPQAKLVRLRLTAASGLRLKAWGVEVRGGVLHVLLINKGGRSASVRLKVPYRGPATVERLRAPRVTSSGHVTFANQRLTRYGTWAGRRRVETVKSIAGRTVIRVPAYSEALITVQLRHP